MQLIQHETTTAGVFTPPPPPARWTAPPFTYSELQGSLEGVRSLCMGRHRRGRLADSTADAPPPLRLRRAFDAIRPAPPPPTPPAVPDSFVLRPAAQIRSICAWEILISPRFLGKKKKKKKTQGEGAGACLCLPARPRCGGYARWQTFHRNQPASGSHPKPPERSDSSPNCVDECLNQRLSLSGLASLETCD